MKKLMLAFVAGVGFSALAVTIESVLSDEMRVAGSGNMSVLETPPEKSDGDGDGNGDDPPDGTGGGGSGTGGGGETPPDKPDGEGGEGGEGGGGSSGSSDSVVLTGAYSYTCETNTLANNATLASTASDQNVVLAMTNAYVTVSNCVLNKSGDTSSEDNSNFYAVNAVVAAKTGSLICIADSELNSNATGANCLFASGEGSTIYAYDCEITSTKGSSRGLDATYEGTVIAAKMTINTSGDHCAAFATDRGNGYISVRDATMATAGQGSPLIYSTGIIEVNGVTGTATGAQIAGIEGLSTIRIRNSSLSGSGEKASEPVANGVIIYQSNSGDYTEGTATFEVSDSTLNSAITNGALFYVTHSEAVITVQKTDLAFDTDKNCLLKAAGNDGSNGWGDAGSNGAVVVFTAIDQTLAGNVSVDGISSLDMYLVNSTYTGTFVNDTTYTGSGDGIDLFIASNSTWTVTESCTLKSLTAADGATIVDGSGNTVSIVNTSGTKHVTGTSALTVTVSSYATEDVAASHAITAFEISRTAFGAMYGTTESEEDADEDEDEDEGSGGATDHDGWVYYCQPHPPDNAIVKVRVADATEYGTPDWDHKYCLDGYWDGNAATGVVVHLLYVTTEGYLFAGGCTSNTWDVTVTNNTQEIYPPDDVVAIRAQAKSGRTYYLTLKEAIDAASDRAKITLNDNVTLEETLTVTNSITLDLCSTNVLTLASALTNAFHFTAGGTVSNGTINSSLSANVGDSVLMRFTDCKATLKDLTINGKGYETVVAHDSATSSVKKNAMTCENLILTGNGCLLSVDYATATLTNDCAFTFDNTLASFGDHAAAIYCTSHGSVSILGGTYVAPTILLADDYGVFYKSDDVTIAAPDGYAWENGLLVATSSADLVTPGAMSDAYDDAQSATNAAAVINADKAATIAVPADLEDDLVSAYLALVEATVTSNNCVVVDLTSAAQSNEQVAVDAAITNEAVVASLVSTNASATVTLETTTPGLYYWIQGGTDVGAVTNAGTAALSTDGGSVKLSKPTLDATTGRAFFKVAAGVSAPAQSDND